MRRTVLRLTGTIVCLLFVCSCNTTAPMRSEGEPTQHVQSRPYVDPRLTQPQPLDYWGKPQELLDRQAQAILDLVNETLDRFPPTIPEPIERRMALLLVDSVVHDPNAPGRTTVQDFFHQRIETAIEDIENTQVKEGANIWKLYNMGFVVRTPTITIGFDLIRGHHRAGPEEFAVSDDIMQRVIQQCDVLFISHKHEDHADEWVARAFIDQGKPVVAPTDVWRDESIESQTVHLEPTVHLEQSVSIPKRKCELKVVAYPGHQGTGARATPNNVWLVFTPDGMSFCQTGDQSGGKTEHGWIEEVSNHYKVDVLMPNCWSPDLIRMANGIDPALIIPGHENIMDPSHAIDHQEPYWLDYVRLHQSPSPFLIMTWGESFHYRSGLKKEGG